MTERHGKILESLAAAQRIEVSTLANILEVSQVTVRKDLDQLEDMGLIRREHGFALFGSMDDVGRRMAIHYEVKRRIARAAAALVDEGETVMIESGSCCAMLAEELANTRKDVTIVTNSVFIADHIRHAPCCKIILLGGEYQPNSQVTVGSITRHTAQIFMSDKFFIGTDGFNERCGFTGKDHMRSQTVRDIAEQVRQVIILTESEKFLHQGVERTILTEDVSQVFTDDRIPPDKEAFLQRMGVAVYKVLSSVSGEASSLPHVISTVRPATAVAPLHEQPAGACGAGGKNEPAKQTGLQNRGSEARLPGLPDGPPRIKLVQYSSEKP
ncbi:MAG: DeoR/GlpR family DNA-binding transcription regulator [Treponema sp.]|jgi:DeoR/GlpR family transcriptional regulator of sugar metabolism|nr:DeoR/GlpR family DNA-binding transcription regulator [Treponema sp.]